jgi:hypothetical protein
MNLDFLRQLILDNRLSLEEAQELTGGKPMIIRQRLNDRYYESFAHVKVCPKCLNSRQLDDDERLERHKRIVEMFNKGCSMHKIAARMRMSESNLYMELRKAGLRWCTQPVQIKQVMNWRRKHQMYLDLPEPELRAYVFAGIYS